MLEMLKARKEALQERGVKGFTLMEMLIVIAIIAILIAIAIPIFSQQLARANAATDEANIRSGYAQVQTEILLGEPEASYTLNTDGTVSGSTPEAGKVVYETKGNAADLGNGNTIEIGGVPGVTWTNGQNVVYSVDVTNKKITGIEGEDA